MLTVLGLRMAIAKGMKEFEEFYKQFDVVEFKLLPHVAGRKQNVFIMMKVELFNPVRNVSDNGEGVKIQENVELCLRNQFPNVDFKWGGGFSGGSPRGWDKCKQINFPSEAAEKLPKGETTLFLYVRP